MKSSNDSDHPFTNDVAAWVGLDWADRGHQVCLYEVATGKVESARVESTAEGLHQWLQGLQARYQGARVAVVLEQSRGAVVHALMHWAFIRMYPVNPQSLASYRKALYPSGAKSDPSDAQLLMEMVRNHPSQFRPWRPDDEATRSLRLLSEGRRKLVDQKQALTNQLMSLLKGYYPQALEWLPDLGTHLACDFLEKWPSLADLKQARPARIRQLFQHYHPRRSQRLHQQLTQLPQALALTTDPAVVSSSLLMAQALVAQIRPLISAIEQFDQHIASVFQHHPDRLLFESFPGAGACLAPRLLAAFGADRDRFQSALQVQQCYGVAPVTEKSGNQHWVHWRLACPKFWRQTFHEFAEHSRRWCQWAKAFYQQQRARGKKHHAAVRSLAYKWIRIMFRCWKDRRPYDSTIYLQALSRRQSPLMAAIKGD